MAEFVAIHQTDASLLPCLFRRMSGKLPLGPREPAAGVGSFTVDDLVLRKRPLAVDPVAEKLAEGVESEAALVCAGVAGEARAFDESTTLPFRFKRWLFAMAGDPVALLPARAALVAGLPDHLRRSTKGDSSAEALFFAFLSRLRTAGRLDDADVDAQTVGRALAAAIGDAERAFEQASLPLPPLAAVVSNRRVLCAVRRGHPLHLGVVDGLLPCARCELGADANPLDPRVDSHRKLRAVVLRSAGEAAEGFREVAEGEVVAIGRDLAVPG